MKQSSRSRLLIVTFDPPTGPGGIEGRTNAYAGCLVRRGIHVEVAAILNVKNSSAEPYQGTRLIRLPSSLAYLPRTVSSLIRTISSSALDDVFFLSGGATATGVLVIGFSRLTGRKCGVFFYGRDILQARNRPGRGIFLLLSMLLAGRVATNSRYTAGLLPFSPRRRPVVIYPGVDPGMAEGLPTPNPDETRPRILFVGRLVKRKGADLLLVAFRQLRSRFPGSRLDVVGDGPELGDLRKLAQTLRLGDSVTFHGALDGAELRERYARASVLVMPSRESREDVEGFGTVFLEAGVFGVPSVGTRTGGIPEAIIEGVTGRLVDGGDVEALKNAIQDLLTDPLELHRLGENARARAAKFTWNASTEQVLQLFRD